MDLVLFSGYARMPSNTTAQRIYEELALVANGSPACLAAADAVTGHYLEDGVAQAFDTLLHIHPIHKGESHGTNH